MFQRSNTISVILAAGGTDYNGLATFTIDKKYSTLTLVSKSGTEHATYPGVSYWKDSEPTSSMGARTGVLRNANDSVDISDYTTIGLKWFGAVKYNIIFQ